MPCELLDFDSNTLNLSWSYATSLCLLNTTLALISVFHMWLPDNRGQMKCLSSYVEPYGLYIVLKTESTYETLNETNEQCVYPQNMGHLLLNKTYQSFCLSACHATTFVVVNGGRCEYHWCCYYLPVPVVVRVADALTVFIVIYEPHGTVWWKWIFGLACYW